MKLKHEFLSVLNNRKLGPLEYLVKGDRCIFCGLIINKSGGNVQSLVNKQYPYLTEEEFLIKKLLE